MIITFGQLLQLLAPYVGRSGACDTNDPATRLKVASVLQEYVHRSGSIRKWSLTTKNNSFTLPKDLAVILKVKVNGKTEEPLSKWYEFFDSVGKSDQICSGEEEWANGVIQEVNSFPTIYDHPGGYVIAELGSKCVDPKGATTIIQGLDEQGNDVYTTHKGERIHGERLTFEAGVAKRTTQKFSKITSITKGLTDDYVKYYSQANKESQPTMLSLLGAKETVAEFKRARIVGDRCSKDACYRITILGRIEVFADYHDNDVIPLNELGGIEALAQAKQSTINNNIPAAGFKYQVVDRVIDDAQAYGRSTDTNFDMVKALSPGDIDWLI